MFFSSDIKISNLNRLFGFQKADIDLNEKISEKIILFDNTYNKIDSKNENLLINPENIINDIRTLANISLNDDKQTVWHEGTNRTIQTITISKDVNERIIQQLKEIGETEGFNVETVESPGSFWLEDNSIRRADGKNVVPSKETIENLKDFYYISDERTVFKTVQGMAASVYEEQTYSDSLKDTVQAKSYLEGGNVLNTCLSDGTPAAVIGDESLMYTLKAMNLEDTPENREIAVKQMAEDLGLKPENITLLPQFDFHIDMQYRPLQNGVMAVPDMEAGLEIEKEVFGEKSQQYKLLQRACDETAALRKRAEEELIKKGYKLVKIPSFSSGVNIDGNLINFKNAVTGTNKNGETYYITASSDKPEIDDKIKSILKSAGIDNVYFIKGLQEYIEIDGSLDCLTQER